MGILNIVFLLFIKDLKSFYRRKASIITETILILILVPILWVICYYGSAAAAGIARKEELEKSKGNPSHIEPNSYHEISDVQFMMKLSSSTIELSEDFKNATLSYCLKVSLITTASVNTNDTWIEVIVKEFDDKKPFFDYELVLNSKNIPFHNEPFMIPNPFGDFSLGGDSQSKNAFSSSPEAAAAQYCVDAAFSKLATKPPKETYYIQKADVHSFSESNFAIDLTFQSCCYLLILLLLIPAMFTASGIVAEKENGIHTYLVVMGMHRYIYYLSHMIFAFIKMYIQITLAGVPVAILLWPYGALMLPMFYLLGHVFISFSMIASTLFRKSTFVVLFSLGFIILSTALAKILGSYVTIYDSSMATLLCVVNPMSAYFYAIDHLVIMILFNQSLKGFSDWNYYLPFAVPVICMIFHTILFTALAFYFDYVLRIDDSPKRHPLFLFGKTYDAENIDEDELPKTRATILPTDAPSELMESSRDDERGQFAAYFEPDLSSQRADIEISKLIKKWSNGEVAVRSVSFKAYQDQVTALLGHNGAGKSTIFGILTGFISPTAGIVRVAGEEPAAVGEGSNVGFCPQWDPLFNNITVEEHLRFYGTLKCGDNVPEEEVDEILEKIGLANDRKVRATNLSGGMKRKLCLGIALIGNSKVILLDEPTAGMDTMARRAMLQLIEKAKIGRTVLLTTHYMDEADFLSDRIIIMAKGEVVCNGSSDFLRARFATGFVLTIDFESASKTSETLKKYQLLAADALNVVIKHCEGAKIDGPVGHQINMVLPYGSQRKFPKLFKELESRQKELLIESFDVRVNNLEQVFIKVTNYADSDKNEETVAKIHEFIEMREPTTRSGFGLFISQLIGLLIRKGQFTMRHYLRTAFPYVLVLVLLIFLSLRTASPQSQKGSISKWQTSEGTNLEEYPEMKVIILRNSSTQYSPKFLKPYLKKAKNVEVLKKAIPGTMTKNGEMSEIQVFQNMAEMFSKEAFASLPPMSFGIGINKINERKIVNVLWREGFPNGVPLALNAISNSRFGLKGKVINTTITITPSNEKNDDSNVQHPATFGSPYDAYINFLIVSIMPVVFILPVYIHIAEIHQLTLHLYLRTHMHAITYWLAAFICDYVLSLIPIIFAMIMIFAFSYIKINLLLAFSISIFTITFGFLSQAYVVSSIFKTSTIAIILLLVFNLIFFGVAVLIVTLISALPGVNPSFISFISTLLQTVFPTYSLFTVIAKLQLNTKMDTHVTLSSSFEYCEIMVDGSSSSPDCLGISKPIVSAFLTGVFYTTILLVITFRHWIAKILCSYCKPTPLEPLEEDPDVTAERKKVEQKGIESFAVCTQGLRKDFSGSKIAVRDLTVGIPAGECFGLLGPNGAGKSTTFNMLTAILRPTDGSAVVDGVDIGNRPMFGFCPQKDALLGDLTVYETMMLFCRLNGISHASEIVECLMECLRLSHKRDNQAQNCSGGERRRLSIAVALLTNNAVIMLDEPTAGVDPRTRRHVWELLLALRSSGTSQVLTSHSMEECEALCTRIGFINRGQLVGIGTSQHLKHRYGNSYMLSITMHGPNEVLAAHIDATVQQQFYGRPIATKGCFATLTWTIPRAGVPLSQLYEQLIRLVDSTPMLSNERRAIKDFALVGTSLEEVFFAMTRQGNNNDVH